MISKPRRSVLSFLTAVAAVAILVAPKYAAAVDCGTRGSQDAQAHPAYSGTLPNLLTTASGDKYIYTATEWGFARASLANPASPGPLQLIQIGRKFTPGDNGGLIYMGCDCYQGASTMDAAEAPDGSSRLISDWVASYTDVLKGMVANTTGTSSPSFGNQININQVALGSTVAAIYHPASGRYFGYFPSNNGLQIVDLTSTNGSIAPSLALQPSGSFPWSGVGVLKAGIVSIGGLPRVMLAGYVGPTRTLRVAEIGSDGVPVEKASVASVGPNAVYWANVNNKAYLFSADNASGLNVYEYTGSALNFAGNLPGYYNNVIVKGNPGGNFPAIFLHRSIRSPNNPTDPQDGVDIWDSKWLASGSPVRAITIAHQGSVAPGGRGNAIEAVVTGTGSQITAHLYRLGTTSTPGGEHLLLTDNVDISCIAADTTSPPTSNATFHNISADSRSDKANYYGDKVSFTDNSSTGVPITRVDWDVVTPAVGTFAPDAAVGTGNTLTGYFPCDPAGGADFVGGGGACKTSIFGAGVPAATASFKFAERSTNQNGVAQNPPGPPAGVFYSSALAFRQPQIGILGYNATTSTLSVLSGGNADATPTQGNTAEATFQWTFNPGNVARSGISVPVPTGASTFTLLVTWKAGYSQSLTGNINQTDLVPEFTMSPASPPGVTVNGTVTLTNAMQKSPATVLNSVDYAIGAGNCPANLPAFSQLPSIFVTSGTVGVTAPSSAGSYCVTLRYNYTPPTGGPTSQSVSHNLTVAIQSNVSLTCDQTSIAAGSTLTCTATGGSSSATFRWNWGDDFPPVFTAGSNPSSHIYTSAGGRTVTVSMTDGGLPVTGNFAVTVTGGSSGGGGLSATINGPSSGSIGSPVSFSANATGGSGSYSYAWVCDYTVLGGSSQFIPGQQTTSCTYSSNGTRTVAVRVADASSTFIATAAVGIGGGGPGPGGLAVAVTGPATGSANAALTYTASASGGSGPYTYAWACDYNALAGSGQFQAGSSTATCTFTGNGAHTVAVRATDSATNTVVNTTSTNITGPGLPSTVFTATGATLVSGSTFTVGAGQSIVFTSAEGNATSWGWNFGDGTLGTGKSITKTYSGKGDFTGQLIVTGNGTGAVGMNIASFTIHVVTPPPSGAFTVSGANPNAAGTVFTAAAGQEVTLVSSEPNAISWGWDFGDGTSGSARTVKKTYSQLGDYTVKLFVTGNDRDTTGLIVSTFTVSVVSCVSDASTLCLNENRFRATVAWAVPPQQRNGTGAGVALTGDTGYYWFFSPTNIELVLKVVDGRAFNGNFWVFYGALSNVEYTITVKDTKTGAVKTYTNPYGTTASLADVNAFPGGAAPTAKTTMETSAIGVVCAPASASIGQQVSCTASPDGTYSWNWGDDFPPRYTGGPNPNVHTFSTSGTFRVTATTDAGITTGSTTVVITPVRNCGTHAGDLRRVQRHDGNSLHLHGYRERRNQPLLLRLELRLQRGEPELHGGHLVQPLHLDDRRQPHPRSSGDGLRGAHSGGSRRDPDGDGLRSGRARPAVLRVQAIGSDPQREYGAVRGRDRHNRDVHGLRALRGELWLVFRRRLDRRGQRSRREDRHAHVPAGRRRERAAARHGRRNPYDRAVRRHHPALHPPVRRRREDALPEWRTVQGAGGLGVSGCVRVRHRRPGHGRYGRVLVPHREQHRARDQGSRRFDPERSLLGVLRRAVEPRVHHHHHGHDDGSRQDVPQPPGHDGERRGRQRLLKSFLKEIPRPRRRPGAFLLVRPETP